MTVEGAPSSQGRASIRSSTAPTAAEPYGKRFIRLRASHRHDGFRSAVHLGAISKTINMPNDASIDDGQDARTCSSWQNSMPQRAPPLYRDGSKLSQPLSAVSSAMTYQDIGRGADRRAVEDEEVRKDPAEHRARREAIRWSATSPSGAAKNCPCVRRDGYTQKTVVGGHKIYLRTGRVRGWHASARSSSTCTRRARPSAVADELRSPSRSRWDCSTVCPSTKFVDQPSCSPASSRTAW